MAISKEAAAVMQERFGVDQLISLATCVGSKPYVRTVNAYYEDGSFYIITNAQSGKMRQLSENPNAAVSGDWFTGEGIGENLGHMLLDGNRNMAEKLRQAFASWYGNGHVNELDPDTVILRIRLTHGVLFDHGTRYDIVF